MHKIKRLELRGISKQYPGCLANDNIDLTIEPGEIHALLGENGAGKSTLMKIIYGVTQPNQGEVFFNEHPVNIKNPAQARDMGIGMVFQHFSLFESLTIVENIALALGKQGGDIKSLSERIRIVSSRYGMPLQPDRLVATLSTGERQRVEIVRCLVQDIELLILDEPTSVLTPQEVEALFSTLRHLSSEGCSILFISHKLHEVTALCDHATILRHGKVSGTCIPKQETSKSIATMMVGNETPISTNYNKVQGDEVFLCIDNLSTNAKHDFEVALKKISLNVKKGEILGIAGVAGNGQEELLMALSGEIRQKKSKNPSIYFDGQPVDSLNPFKRRRLGMGFVPEDRLGRGAVPTMTLSQNTLLTSFDFGLVKNGLIQVKKMKALANLIIEKYKVKAVGEFSHAESLSGGNLQKFIIGREMQQNPKLLLASHPTWGVDIGAQVAIHKALIQLRDQGGAILVVSEDLDELYQISDRLCAICDGELSPIKATNEVSLETVGCWMAGDFSVDSVNEKEIVHVAS
ncbi:ABC transporter ATP-binding protein [Psychromonas antarctica]|uniref:ABC transporter ATP-binding protein n=1 Tax=Psychromonas antarctica TaxID=67573 RepID=UPI001EE9092C|nr:ABC transporter ATP-binding protein [Psychromonas antarctica]MCG6202409.1 ABC transporter ATP-binding protein [Psychromonas antarctica]